MNPLYNIGIRSYKLGAKVLALTNDKARRMVHGQKETFAYLAERFGNRKGAVWIHASSLGEFEQGRPLIERLRREHPELPLLLTFFSPSGYEVRKNYDKVDAVAYLPFDTPANARRFIEIVRPSMAIFVKYEFWGNYLQQLARHEIPTYIISAIFRPNQIFFKHHGSMFRKMLGCFKTLYLQDEASRRLLESIGVTNTVVAGDTRFDRVTDIMAQAAPVANIDQLSSFVIFGSSWPADEEAYIPWLNAHPDVRFIIAPHEFDDARVSRLCDAIEGYVVTLSQWESGKIDRSKPVRGVVVDCFGKLATLYRVAKVAYVGGGFGAGIHNINEAAVYGIPVVFGPRFDKFKEARDLTSLGGAFTADNQQAVYDILERLYGNERLRSEAGAVAGKYIRDNLGATDRIYRDLF